MKIIYLEPDEEITSVIERLKAIDDPEVAIVVPKRAGILQSIINLKLLRFQSEKQKKRLSVVTTDKTGRNLASAVGLTVYQKLPEGSEVIDAAIHEPSGDAPAPIRINTPQPPVDAVPPPRQEPPAPPAPPLLKRRKSIIPRREPSREATPLEPSLPTPAGPVTPVPEEPPQPERPVPASASVSPEPTPEPVPPVARPPRRLARPSLPHPNLRRPTLPRPNFFRPGAAKPNVPKPTVPRFSRPTLRNLPKLAGNRRLGAGLLSLLVAIALFLIPTFALASATVTVGVRTTPVSADIPVVFSARSQAVDSTANIIPAKTIEVSKDATVQASATGQRQNGGHATGTISISNRLAKPQSLVARTRFAAPDGNVYRIQSGVTVPGGSTAQATVTADAAGDAGNAAAGTPLSLVAIANSAVSATVSSGISGGGSGTGATEVSADDVEKAKAALAHKAAADGLAAAKSKLAVGYKLDERTVSTTVDAVTATPPVGTAGSTFTVAGNVRIVYFTYEESALQKVVQEDTQTKVPAGSHLMEAVSLGTFAATQSSTETVSGTFGVKGSAAVSGSTQELQREVAGKSAADAEQALRANGQATSLGVHFSPPWIRHIPRRLSKIHLKYLATGTASPAPTPTPSAAPSVSQAPSSGLATAAPAPAESPAPAAAPGTAPLL